MILWLRRIGELSSTTVRVYGWNNITQNECHCITSKLRYYFFSLLLTMTTKIIPSKIQKPQNYKIKQKRAKYKNTKTIKFAVDVGVEWNLLLCCLLIYFASLFLEIFLLLCGAGSGSSIGGEAGLSRGRGGWWMAKESQICFFWFVRAWVGGRKCGRQRTTGVRTTGVKR